MPIYRDTLDNLHYFYDKPDLVRAHENPPSIPVDCGNCSTRSGATVIAMTRTSRGQVIRWLKCQTCESGLVMINGTTWPPSMYGPEVQYLPQSVNEALRQARLCFSIGAYEATELVCRKILMHVACDLGDREGKSFAEYIDFLKNNGYITRQMEDWVDEIRERGNRTAHRLASPTPEQAQSTLDFCIQLLRLVYELPSRAKLHTQQGQGS